MSDQTITRAELITRIVEKFEVERDIASQLLEKTLTVIGDSLIQGKQVKIPTFGTFVVRSKSERMGRNPRTGVKAKITPRKVVTFRASPFLKKAIA